jgi:flagellar protein FlaG
MSNVNAVGTALVASVEYAPRQAAAVPRQAAVVSESQAEAARPAAQAPAAAPASDRELEAATGQIERFVRSSGRSLQFRVDEDSGRVVVSVRDADTGDLIRQIPSEAALRIARALGRGESTPDRLLIDEEV